jgi:hypothetical protein
MEVRMIKMLLTVAVLGSVGGFATPAIEMRANDKSSDDASLHGGAVRRARIGSGF